MASGASAARGQPMCQARPAPDRERWPKMLGLEGRSCVTKDAGPAATASVRAHGSFVEAAVRLKSATLRKAIRPPRPVPELLTMRARSVRSVNPNSGDLPSAAWGPTATPGVKPPESGPELFGLAPVQLAGRGSARLPVRRPRARMRCNDGSNVVDGQIDRGAPGRFSLPGPIPVGTTAFCRGGRRRSAASRVGRSLGGQPSTAVC